MRESRDSLREEISQNLNENLAEHEVVTETVFFNDSLKIERIIDRVRTLESGSKRQDSRVVVRTEVVRDTVYVERVDTVEVQKFDLRSSSFAPRQYSIKLGTALGLASVQGTSSSLNPHPSALRYLKWIFWILIGLIGLTITVKVCLRR